MASKVEVKELILTSVERCLAMQAEHLAGLKSGGLDKIDQWLKERQDMVACLRQSLAHVRPAEVDDALRALLLDRIGRILEGEEVLFKAAEQQRTGLIEKITSVRRGKRALHGYGPKIHRTPRFVSDKG